MLTQQTLDHLTDIAESMMAISNTLHHSLVDSFGSLPEYNAAGLAREDVLGQVLALKVLAKDLDLSLIE